LVGTGISGWNKGAGKGKALGVVTSKEGGTRREGVRKRVKIGCPWSGGSRAKKKKDRK